ncbi:hypothetical protein QQZ08_005436 [Neonectria magnoliae]|uniref:Uncharacterized protein n=1 Tax=Neonectria magnoliae TaxID=2732573 RepID=A0ABR1I3E4_9HYPO
MANENGASLERSKGAPSHSSARNQNSHQSGEQPVDTSIDVANETQQSAQEPDEPSSQHAEQIVNAFDETVIESLDSPRRSARAGWQPTTVSYTTATRINRLRNEGKLGASSQKGLLDE